jgi:DNA-binding NarL/FixJ family response regulator
MKQESIEHLAGAIKRVLSGQFYLSERLSQRLLERVGDELRSAGDATANLTMRELEVLRMIGRGLRTAAIAHELGLSVKTVDTYRSNIKSKLHLTNAIELLRYAAIWAERL